NQVETGFNPERVVAVSLTLPDYKYPEKEQRRAFYRQTLERIENLPGVTSAAATTMLPLSGSNSSSTFGIVGRPSPDVMPSVNLRAISPDYFKTMEIPLLRGRTFAEQDTEASAMLCLINETMARRYFPDEDPIGKRITIIKDEREIVGVVGDVRHAKLDAEAGAEMYTPYLQAPAPYINFVARSRALDEASLAAAVRNAIHAVDKDQTIHKSRTMEELLSRSIAQPRFNTWLLSIFAAIALVLAMVGIFGVMNYTVAQRTHEIGIRRALGAQGADVMRLVVGHGMMLALLGVGVGLAGAFALTRFLASLLYGVSATDGWTFSAVALLLSAVAFVACYIPARRATKVDPMIALRYE
ncbi:MAG: ABC transporter permease, partial [Acidobacteria bacterium]|nr:ABC transporter permease [Acidobacteriota bacterium]